MAVVSDLCESCRNNSSCHRVSACSWGTCLLAQRPCRWFAKYVVDHFTQCVIRLLHHQSSSNTDDTLPIAIPCSQVLSWQKAQPEEAERVTSRLNLHNSHVEAGFTKLLALFELPQQDTSSFEKARSEIAQYTFDQVCFAIAMNATWPVLIDSLTCLFVSMQWQRIDPVLGRTLKTIREEFLAVRSLLRCVVVVGRVPLDHTVAALILDFSPDVLVCVG